MNNLHRESSPPFPIRLGRRSKRKHRVRSNVTSPHGASSTYMALVKPASPPLVPGTCKRSRRQETASSQGSAR